MKVICYRHWKQMGHDVKEDALKWIHQPYATRKKNKRVSITCENGSTGIYNSPGYRNLPVTKTSEEKSIEKAC